MERGEAPRRGLLEGLRASTPVVAGYLPAAIAFGVAARGAGLSAGEALLMSLIVYSGASQFAVVGLVAAGASWLVMAVTALALGARHVLYGPALAPRLRRLNTGDTALAAFGLTDEVFAVASARLPRGPAGLGWLLGLELGAYATWAFGTGLGAVAGAALVEAFPLLAPALSFALPALFMALLVSMLKAPGGVPGRPLAGAILAAVTVAVTFQLAGLGGGSVPVAGVAGPLVGFLLWRGPHAR